LIIYCAGPYRSTQGWNGVLENILAARKVARELWKMGWTVLCPHANSILMDGPDIPDRTFLDGDLELLHKCDAVFALPGWENSIGAREEVLIAHEHGLPVWMALEEVPDLTRRQGNAE
jgi:hypothetical protein